MTRSTAFTFTSADSSRRAVRFSVRVSAPSRYDHAVAFAQRTTPRTASNWDAGHTCDANAERRRGGQRLNNKALTRMRVSLTVGNKCRMCQAAHACQHLRELVSYVKVVSRQRTTMPRWLRAVVDWIFGRRASLVQLSLQAPNPHGASRNGRQGPDPPKRPYDPDCPVRAPKWHGPTDRRASVAVAEPVDDDTLVVIGGGTAAYERTVTRLLGCSGARVRAELIPPNRHQRISTGPTRFSRVV